MTLDPPNKRITVFETGGRGADLQAKCTSRRAELARALGSLREQAGGLPLVREVLDALLADADLAWRAFACALLAEELEE